MFEKKKIDHVAVIKLDHAGDVLWTTPAISTLRANYPSARISVFCTPYTKSIWENNPAVDDLIPYNGEPIPASFGIPDIALCLDTRTPAVKLTYSTKALLRCGYYYFPRGFSFLWALCLLTKPVLHPASRGNYVHEVEANRQLLERIGCHAEPNIPSRLFLTESEIIQAKKLLYDCGYRHGKIITIHLPLKWIDGNWPVEHVAKMINNIGQRWSDVTLFLSCGPGEESLLTSILPLLTVSTLVITGQSFRVWAALLQQSHLLICRDCGPVHVAAALGVPVISIFEESKRREHTRWEPWLIPHNNIFRPDVHSFKAEEVFKSEIINAIEPLLTAKPSEK